MLLSSMDQACWICKLSNCTHPCPNPDPKLPAYGAEPPACWPHQVRRVKLTRSDHRERPPASDRFCLFYRGSLCCGNSSSVATKCARPQQFSPAGEFISWRSHFCCPPGKWSLVPKSKFMLVYIVIKSVCASCWISFIRCFCVPKLRLLMGSSWLKPSGSHTKDTGANSPSRHKDRSSGFLPRHAGSLRHRGQSLRRLHYRSYTFILSNIFSICAPNIPLFVSLQWKYWRRNFLSCFSAAAFRAMQLCCRPAVSCCRPVQPEHSLC